MRRQQIERESPTIYPQTAQVDAADEHIGQKVADPYRWLENDIRGDPAISAWVDAKNSISAPYPARLQGRDVFRERLAALFDHERLTAPEKVAEYLAPVLGHAIYFHRHGTEQSEDRLVHAPEADLPMIHTADLTADGRYAEIYSTALTGGNGLAVADLSTSNWPIWTEIDTFDHTWLVAGNIGTKFFLSTQKGAERGRIVTTDLADCEAMFVELIAERQDKVLKFGTLVGNCLIVSYMHDAKTEVERYRIDGTPDGIVELPGVGSAGDFHGRPGDDEAFFVFTGHDAPTRIYRYDVATNSKTAWAEPKVAIDLSNILVEQHIYASKDGTQVPIFVVRRADVTAPAPTMLTAYGGFGIAMVPFYSPVAMAWVEQGGIYAIANIRGAGEYGEAWHDAGRGRKKAELVR